MPAHKSDTRLLQVTGLYLMCNVPFIWKCKVGITDNKKARRASVSDTTKGRVFTVLCLTLTYAHSKEKFIHTLYAWANSPFKNGSGRGEWFLNISPVVGCMAWALWPELPMPVKVLFFFNPLIWLDGLFWLLLFAAFQVVVVVGVLAGVYFFMIN